MRAVRAHDVPEARGLLLPVAAQDRSDRLSVLPKRHQLDTPLDATVLLLEVLSQEPLRDPLLDIDRERIGRVEVFESLRAQLASLGRK
jgi:hypothetical protein